MFQTRKDVDKHVRQILGRLRDDEVSEFAKFCFTKFIYITIACGNLKRTYDKEMLCRIVAIQSGTLSK